MIKKLRNKSEICDSIIKRARGVNNMITDIILLQDKIFEANLHEKALNIITQYKEAFTYIALKKHLYFTNHHLNITKRTIAELLNYENELIEDMNCLSRYQKELLNIIDENIKN